MHEETPAAVAARGRTCRIHLVRHGQTVMNAQVRFRGRLEVPLNDVGRSEARQAARALVGAGLVSVYTSPLGRARRSPRRSPSQTASAPFARMPT